MKIALAQINPTIGDLAGNVERCLAAMAHARAQAADLVVLPEMAIPGYPPRDVLFDASFTNAVFEATHDLAQRAQDFPPTLVGSLAQADSHLPHHPNLHNAVFLARDGGAHLVAAKRLLPAYDVFYEPRWFVPGVILPPIIVADKKIGVVVCEDLWDERYPIHPPFDLITQGAEVLICLAASPYHRQIFSQRLYHARRQQCPIVYVNQCGANDELIFDGRSFVLDKNGRFIAQLPAFEESFQVVDLGQESILPFDLNEDEELYRALVLGVRDFANKNRITRAVVGVSGGVDSSVVAVIAAEALGAENVTAVAIPSRYTDPRSTTYAQTLAQSLGIEFRVVELEQMHAAVEASLGDLLTQGTGAENAQARLRAMVLMSFVNRYSGMLLNTSNKTELALGYSTLYGDMAGTLCPIADLTKTQVYALANWINSTRNVIPSFAIQRAPSAELRPDQIDPFDYATVSPAMEQLVQANQSDDAMRRSEHKRWQAGVILKVSPKAFGTGRMIPITRR